MFVGIAKDIAADSVNDRAAQAYKKVTWRLVPLLFLAYVVSYLDRVNVGFAKLQMLSDLNFSETVYGLGAGIFFIGYALFEVPSNIILHKVGARRWIARIMITWGLLAASMMFVRTPTSFYILRFLLGVSEAGFQPGIVLYLTYWYPEQRRGRIMALFFAAVPASGVIGGPLSGWILGSFSGAHGLSGWQWMFVLEALPAVLVGFVVLRVLPDRIRNAPWLTHDEVSLLEENVRTEEMHKHDLHLRDIFRDPRVLLMACIYFCMVIGAYGVSFWLPTMIKATGVVNMLHIGLLTAIPSFVAIVFMLAISRSADATGERKMHLAATISLGVIGLSLSVIFSSNTTASLIALSIGAIGVYSALPLFWTIPTAYLSGVAAAGGIAFINSFANISGFIGPYLIGWIKQTTGSTDIAMLALAAASALGVLLTLLLPAKMVNRSREGLQKS